MCNGKLECGSVKAVESEKNTGSETLLGLDTAYVTRAMDGNTIEVYLNGNTVDVRLLLVDR